MVFALAATAFAADVASATIDRSKTGSITIYKYDTTTAQKNGLKDGVYLSTGKENPDAAAAYAPYAIPGVEFTILRVGDIDTYTVSDGKTNTTQVIYGVSDSTATIPAIRSSTLWQTSSAPTTLPPRIPLRRSFPPTRVPRLWR